MAGRTPAEAVNNFLEPIQLALSCITDEIVTVAGGYHPSEKPHALLLARGTPATLLGDRGLSLIALQRYRLVEDDGPRGPWKVQTTAYNYTILDNQERELFAYHWHPTEHTRVTWPHVHLGGGLEVANQIGKVHLPTGRVAVEQIIALLLTEMDVVPARDDWEAVLDKSLSAFQSWRTWG